VPRDLSPFSSSSSFAHRSSFPRPALSRESLRPPRPTPGPSSPSQGAVIGPGSRRGCNWRPGPCETGGETIGRKDVLADIFPRPPCACRSVPASAHAARTPRASAYACASPYTAIRRSTPPPRFHTHAHTHTETKMRSAIALAVAAVLATTASAQVVPGAPTDPVAADGELCGLESQGQRKAMRGGGGPTRLDASLSLSAPSSPLLLSARSTSPSRPHIIIQPGP
jgi:hypothetical protein